MANSRSGDIHTGGGASIKGDVSANTFIGRDQINQFQTEPDFFTPNYSRFDALFKVGLPPVVKQLVQHINSNRLLILRGEKGVDANEIARQCAWQLKNEPVDHPIANQVHVKEWKYRHSALSFEQFLREKDPTIFVLPNVAPHHFQYTPLKIRSALSKSNHYLLASTESNLQEWLPFSTEESKLYWFELSPKTAYPVEYLADLALELLRQASDKVDLLVKQPASESTLNNSISLQELCEKINTPHQLEMFALLLNSADSRMNAERIEELILQVDDRPSFLAERYQKLELHQQLLLIASILFNGLSEDQFFAASEFLLFDNWRQRNPQLPVFDYGDLDALKFAVNFTNSSNSFGRVELRDPTYQDILLKLIWHTNRRYLKVTLPLITRMALDSIHNPASNAELYGEQVDREQLQVAIGQALSIIGILSLDSVEKYLLHLAADPNEEAQIIAAVAMARWREQGEDTQLLNTLQRWQTEFQIRDFVLKFYQAAILAQNPGATPEDLPQEKGYEIVRQTVALTTAFAVLYDRPNTLSTQMVELIEDLASDSSAEVQLRFRGFTWLFAVSLHAFQLRNQIENVILNASFITTTAYGLVNSWQNDPKQTTGLLDHWWSDCHHMQITPADEWPPKWREAMLATLVCTYSVALTAEKDQFTDFQLDTALRRIQTIFEDKSEHPFVRRFALWSLLDNTQESFSSVHQIWRQIIPTLSESECHELLQIMLTIYLEQRQDLEGGDVTIRVNGKEYPVWIDELRPVTHVEQVVRAWIKDVSNPLLQQFALECQVEFANFLDVEEIKKIDLLRSQGSAEKPEQEVIRSRNEQRVRAPDMASMGIAEVTPKVYTPLSELRLFILSLFMSSLNDYQKTIVTNLIPEALRQTERNQVSLSTVLNTWSNSADEQLREIEISIRRALNLLESGLVWKVALGFGFVLFIILLLITAI